MRDKNAVMMAAVMAVVFIMLSMAGCASTPTKLEQKIFSIQTNVVEQVVVSTNQVWQTNVAQVYRTNQLVDQVLKEVLVTNYVAVAVPVVTAHTNYVTVYDYQPSTNGMQLGAIAKMAGTPFGVGDLAGTAVGGILGLWGLWRSSRSNKTAAVLAQVIETGRKVLQSTPQGANAEQAWMNWMITHQAETGVIREVTKLVGNNVSSAEAKMAADELLRLMQQRENPKG